MNGLKIETFISPDSDFEFSQYKILSGIKEYRAELNKKKIYPSLAEIIKIGSQLEEILNQKENIQTAFPKEIKELDLKNKKIIFETMERLRPDVEYLFDLIEWALPHIKEVVEEAIVLYEFVEENLFLEEVGILPLYKNEGYFMIYNSSDSNFQIHRFESSLFESDQEKYRAIRTKLIKVLEKALNITPESVKLELIKEFEDLPNPATFVCETELDFPFTETIFPVAKRKLMAKVAA